MGQLKKIKKQTKLLLNFEAWEKINDYQFEKYI